MFAATILGGIGNVYGAVIGSFIIAFLENASLTIDWGFVLRPFGLDGSLYLPSGYKFAVSFVALIIILISISNKTPENELREQVLYLSSFSDLVILYEDIEKM